MSKFSGQVVGNILEVRFAFSGQISSVNKSVGEKVVKGDLLAALDKKPWQTDLDRQLADYERIRAEFDLFSSQSNPDNDTTKFLKTQKQAALNASVKDVESAKQKLDQINLYSPVDGVIVEADNLAVGLNVTPAGSTIKILDLSSLAFNFPIKEDQVKLFSGSRPIKIKISSQKIEVSAKTVPLLYGLNDKFTVTAKLEKTKDVLVGLTGEAVLSS